MVSILAELSTNVQRKQLHATTFNFVYKSIEERYG